MRVEPDIVVDYNESTCRVTIQDTTCYISLPPTFTVLQAVPFKQKFQELCNYTPKLVEFVLDFRATKFMDSSGIGALVASRKLSQSQGIQLILRNVSPQVMSALSLADLDKFFVIDPIPTSQPEHFGPLPGQEPRQAPQHLTKLPSGSGRSMPARLMDIVTVEQPPFITHPSVKSIPKRLIDIGGSVIGLAITGVVFVPIAIAIRLESKGPILFGQVRCSSMGKRFKMWKFRSMYADAEQRKHEVKNEASGAIFKNQNDPRITKVGKILRKTSLDELPQFWNVLKGEMSLVGTRPPTPDEVDRYEIPQWQRLDIKPGMTGEWQVNGRSSILDFEDIVRLDLKYQENWSLMYDLQLILKTIWVIFNKNSGAA